MNASEFNPREILNEFVDTPNGILAIFSVVANCFVLATFAFAYKKRQNLAPPSPSSPTSPSSSSSSSSSSSIGAAVELSALGVSDLAFNVLVVVGFAWTKCVDVGECEIDDERVGDFAVFVYVLTFTNRHLTAYIALQRALIVSFPLRRFGAPSGRNLHVPPKGRDRLRHLLIWGVAPMIILGLILGLLRRRLIVGEVRRHEDFWARIFFFFSLTLILSWTLVVACSAAVVVWKTRGMSSRKSRGEEVQLMVASVAVEFVVCHAPLVAKMLMHLFVDDQLEALEKISNFFEVFTTSVNLFLYLLVGKRFRGAFVEMMGCGRWSGVEGGRGVDGEKLRKVSGKMEKAGLELELKSKANKSLPV